MWVLPERLLPQAVEQRSQLLVRGKDPDLQSKDLVRSFAEHLNEAPSGQITQIGNLNAQFHLHSLEELGPFLQPTEEPLKILIIKLDPARIIGWLHPWKFREHANQRKGQLIKLVIHLYHPFRKADLLLHLRGRTTQLAQLLRMRTDLQKRDAPESQQPHELLAILLGVIPTQTPQCLLGLSL